VAVIQDVTDTQSSSRDIDDSEDDLKATGDGIANKQKQGQQLSTKTTVAEHAECEEGEDQGDAYDDCIDDKQSQRKAQTSQIGSTAEGTGWERKCRIGWQFGVHESERVIVHFRENNEVVIFVVLYEGRAGSGPGPGT